MVAPAGQGGTLQYAHNLCNALAAAGHRVVLATGLDCETAAFPRRYDLAPVFDRFRPHPGRQLRFLAQMARMRPQIVHFQGAQRPEFYRLLIWVLTALCRPVFVWTPQDVLSNSDRPSHRRIQTGNYRRMAHVFLNARQNLSALQSHYAVPSDRITVLPIPDLVAFARNDLGRSPPPDLTLDPAAPLVLCFGLIEPRKGIAALIAAFGQVSRQHPGAGLLIMGKALTDIAPFRAALDALALPPGRAQILGRYASFEEMNWLFETASVIVLPYVSGWNSGVLAAAFGYGKPVIASRVGGFDEVIEDGRTGLLIPPGDPQALAAALSRVLGDSALRSALGAAARAAGSRSSWAAVAAETGRVYSAVLDGGTPDGSTPDGRAADG